MRTVRRRGRTHRIHPRVPHLAAPAARGARMNSQDQSAVPNASMAARKLTVGSAPLEKPGVEVPYLRLRGRWLRDAGFAIGRNVKVEVSAGRLTIEPIE